ncbi:hypothetical protein DBR44_09985 [Aquitalea sp. FJL05]|nr:hypothetical protein DBR44_09985 [Aquitalea sp. FJL05]
MYKRTAADSPRHKKQRLRLRLWLCVLAGRQLNDLIKNQRLEMVALLAAPPCNLAFVIFDRENYNTFKKILFNMKMLSLQL